MEKMTYVQAIVNALEVVERDSETYSRLEDLKASLEKKSTSRKKVDNSIYYDKVTKALATLGGKATPTLLVAAIDGIGTTQKLCSVVASMPNVEKETKGKKVYYYLR